MSNTKILDCTLRDGAYLVDKNFGKENIKGIVAGLVEAKIDFIEIGFFQDDGFGEGKTVYANSLDAKKYVPSDKGGCEFTVLADYSRFSVENLDERRSDSIDGVRECFFKAERYDALNACKVIKEKGYKLFVQPVDILGYTDAELLEFIDEVNKIEPYCLSIVDTFGSMYHDDLQHVFEIINHNLVSSCNIGFHSHNNMQMSSALTQEFIRMAEGKRDVVVDGTIAGMGRGAGNTPTELIVQYMTSKRNAHYDMDAVLDLIDNYIDNLRTSCSWGYNVEYFVAGCYGAHVNNISYLTKKASIQSKDIRYILNKIGEQPRKRYDYDLLEKTYLEYVSSVIKDKDALCELESLLAGKNVLVIAPGATARDNVVDIKSYIESENPVVITVNFVHDEVVSDLVFTSNKKRYDSYVGDEKFDALTKILTSNIKNQSDDESEIIVSFSELIRCGWEHIDNAMILLLRLLDRIDTIKSIAIAGFDGYDVMSNRDNYVNRKLEREGSRIDAVAINEDIALMLQDYNVTRVNQAREIKFITDSRFSSVFSGGLK